MFIEIANVHKTYGEGSGATQALRGVNFSIEKGEIVVILGPSGCGKSTLLNSIGGLDSVDSGAIIVDGTNIAKLTQKELASYRQEKLGFIFQHYNLIPDLTIQENVELCQYLSKNPLDINEILSVLGIAKMYNRFPSELSGGQQQRTAIARAMVKNPVLMLCDEPTGALDTKTSLSILEFIEKINVQYGTTFIMVTHCEAVQYMAHRVIRMRDGLIESNYMNVNRIPAQELQL